jgi:hypothetical protein
VVLHELACAHKTLYGLHVWACNEPRENMCANRASFDMSDAVDIVPKDIRMRACDCERFSENPRGPDYDAVSKVPAGMSISVPLHLPVTALEAVYNNLEICSNVTMYIGPTLSKPRSFIMLPQPGLSMDRESRVSQPLLPPSMISSDPYAHDA